LIRSIKDFSRVATFREKAVDVVKVWIRIVRDIRGLRGGIVLLVGFYRRTKNRKITIN
jgi:hypothetical protein